MSMPRPINPALHLMVQEKLAKNVRRVSPNDDTECRLAARLLKIVGQPE